jgi:hypothetical protein
MNICPQRQRKSCRCQGFQPGTGRSGYCGAVHRGRRHRVAGLLAAVAEAVNDEEVRPLGDRVTVRSAEIVDYEIDATLYLYPGPESEPIINAADASLQKFLKQNDKKISRDVARSAISAALHVQGVQRVVLNAPPDDIRISDIQAAAISATTWKTAERMNNTLLPLCQRVDAQRRSCHGEAVRNHGSHSHAVDADGMPG